MVMFVWWEAPISMRVESRCVSMTSGEPCVVTSGLALILLLFVNSWDIHTLEVSIFVADLKELTQHEPPQNWYQSGLFCLFVLTNVAAIRLSAYDDTLFTAHGR